METTTMNVRGMTCGGCVASVTKVLKAIAGVDEVAVVLEPGTARITFDPATVGIPALKSAIEDAGYDVVV
jgi:copper chaperone